MEMAENDIREARKEIHKTLRICNFCIGTVGVSMTDDVSKNIRRRVRTNLALFTTTTIVVLIVLGQYSYIVGQMMKLEDMIEGLIGSNMHVAGYGLMSLGKLVTVWLKRNKFRQLVGELADIWPVSIKDKEEADIKRKSLSALRNRQIIYTFWNALGVWLYNLTPIAILVYHKARGMSSQLGYVYQLSYPFDKTKPIYHEIAYIFETCGGSLSVCIMLGTDLLFITMASHISMLLRVLQVKIRNLIDDDTAVQRITGSYDCYNDIVSIVKIHQRLINYINDLEDAFSMVNLINVLISSVNICCCAFNIVFLDSWMEMSNKFFLGAALTQMGIVCWYADDIFRASVGVSDAVYECGWYRSDARCRRALLLLLQRSQKPLYFTALKFSAITMATYSSVLTNSYSYFTLLYTSYSRN